MYNNNFLEFYFYLIVISRVFIKMAFNFLGIRNETNINYRCYWKNGEVLGEGLRDTNVILRLCDITELGEPQKMKK